MAIIVIQGTADTTNRLTQTEFSGAINHITEAMFRPNSVTYSTKEKVKAAKPTPAEQELIDGIRKRQAQHLHSVEDFTTNVIDGRIPRLQRGNLGLMAFEPV